MSLVTAAVCWHLGRAGFCQLSPTVLLEPWLLFLQDWLEHLQLCWSCCGPGSCPCSAPGEECHPEDEGQEESPLLHSKLEGIPDAPSATRGGSQLYRGSALRRK